MFDNSTIRVSSWPDLSIKSYFLMVSSQILLRSLRVYILHQLFFSISVNSGLRNIYLATSWLGKIFSHHSPRFQRIIVKYWPQIYSISKPWDYDQTKNIVFKGTDKNWGGLESFFPKGSDKKWGVGIFFKICEPMQACDTRMKYTGKIKRES